ncbi:hypothetical protein EMCRGX_G012074 [Ephydatia muelleri]
MVRMILFWVTVAIAIPSSKMQVTLSTLIPANGLTVLEGGTINFGCTASSCVQSLQWVQNGTVRASTASSGACLTSILYTVNPLDPDRDSGIYQCKAQVTNGTVVTQSTGMITIARINAPPDQYVLYGATIALSCSIPSLPYAVILWRNGSTTSDFLPSPIIMDASLSDDHTYTCQGVLNGNTNGYKAINLHVIAPPTILALPPVENVIVPSTLLVNVSVYLQSRPWSTTAIMWYKDGNSLANASNMTVTSGNLQGSTSLVVSRTASRQDGGIYTVGITNNLLLLPNNSRYVQANFTLRIKVLPAAPFNININTLTASHATLTWNLSILIPDETPDNVTVTLLYSNGSTVSVIVLSGATTMAVLHYLPGLNYQVKLATTNMDGRVTAAPLSFSAPYGSPQISSWSIYRLNYTAYSFTISVDSNGGAEIAHVNVSYRVAGTSSGWSPTLVSLNPPSEGLVMSGIVRSQEFTASSGPYEFQLSVVNGAYIWSALMERNETVDLPGAPDISTISNSSSRLSSVLTVHLSYNGSPPILQVIAMVTGSEGEHQLHNRSGPYLPGDTVYIPLEGLQEGVQYECFAYAVNYAGAGHLSNRHTFSIPEPPMLWIIAAAAVPSLLVIFGVALAAIIAVVQQRKKRTLHIGLQPRPMSPIKSGDGSTKEDSGQFGSSSKTTLQPVSEHGSEEEEQKYPRYTYRINPSPDQSVRSLQLPSFLGMDSSRESLSVTAVSQATDV